MESQNKKPAVKDLAAEVIQGQSEQGGKIKLNRELPSVQIAHHLMLIDQKTTIISQLPD